MSDPTPNIIVRHAELSDAAACHRIHTAPRVVWGILQIPYASVEVWRKRLAEKPPTTHQLVACVNDEVVGIISLSAASRSPRRVHAGAIGMGVRDDWQGKGVGTGMMKAIIDLADNWLNLKRLELEVYTDNEPAIALYKKFGFEIEGTLRQFAFRDGQFVDAYYMARLRA